MNTKNKVLLISFAAGLFFVFNSSSAAHGQTLFEHQDDHGDRHDGVATDTDLYAQTFTPTTSHILTRADVWLAQNQGNTGSSTIKLALRSASNGVPTGSDLCSDTRDASNIPVTTSFLPGDGISFSFFPSSCPTLSAGNEYALIFSRTSGSYILHIWGGSNQYLSGNRVYSLNSGATWNTSTLDYYFQEYSGATSPPPSAIKVAVILAEPYGKPHISTSIIAQPCKLIPEKTYASGHNAEYFNDLLFCVNDYYHENSYGAISFDFTIFDNGGEWYKIATSTKTESYYANGRELEFITDAIAEATGDINPTSFDTMSVIHAGEAPIENSNMQAFINTLTNTTFNPLFIKTLTAEDDFSGAWTHELGHALGSLLTPSSAPTPDVYAMGNVGPWDVMANGSSNGYEKDPPHMSSYIKEFLGWLNYDIYPKSAYGTHQVEALGAKQIGDAVFRYNLDDHAEDNTTTPYYILESRNSGIGQWDTSVPENALALYYVNPFGFREYGHITTTDGLVSENQCRSLNIPDPGYLNDGILEADESYGDYDNLVNFEAVSFSTSSTALVSIQPISENSFTALFYGMVLRPMDELYGSACKFAETSVSPPMSVTSVEIPYGPTPPVLFKYYDGVGYTAVSLADLRVLATLFILVTLFLLLVRKSGAVKSFSKPSIFKLFLLIVIGFSLWQFPIVWESVSGPRTSSAIYVPNALFDIFIWYLIACILATAVSKVKTKYFIVTVFLLPMILGWQHVDTKDTHGNTSSVFVAGRTSPDLDLHALTSNGLHVGVNYETGEYESQVTGTIASGDNQGAPEWILLPEGTEAKFYVSSRDNQDFLSANPDIASELATTTDSYELFARYIDPNSGIFTSETLPHETISPGSTTTYDIQGTSSPEVIREITLTPIADSYLKKGSPNQNFGGDQILNVRGDGKRRTLVQFDQSAIASALGSSTLVSVTLELDIIADSAQNWTSEGRIVGVHRLTHSWTESGVTWNCSNDTNTSNSSSDCPGDTWQMEGNDSPSWVATSTDQKLVTNGLGGALRYDVTADAQAFLTGTQNHGWILRKAVDTQSGDIEFSSRETGIPPRLILEIE